MADARSSGEDRQGRAGPGTPPSAPRWVKVSMIVAVVAAVLILALLLLSGGNHGPGRHSSSDDRATPPAVVNGHTPPKSGH